MWIGGERTNSMLSYDDTNVKKGYRWSTTTGPEVERGAWIHREGSLLRQYTPSNAPWAPSAPNYNNDDAVGLNVLYLASGGGAWIDLPGVGEEGDGAWPYLLEFGDTIPYITGIAPGFISIFGIVFGSNVSHHIITLGDGFRYNCITPEFVYNQRQDQGVSCYAPVGYGANLTVMIRYMGQKLPTAGLTFSYKPPNITNVFPRDGFFIRAGADVSSPFLINISGQFGPDFSNITITIGPYTCTVETIAGTYINCKVKKEARGLNHTVTVASGNQASVSSSKISFFSCGDGLCTSSTSTGESFENCTMCPTDCGVCPPVCGDGVCFGDNENCTSCPGDCGECPLICGDGLCSNNSTYYENCTSCSGDCGTCPLFCGDGICSPQTEGCISCEIDCRKCNSTGCPGTPLVCSGHGTCVSSLCQCHAGWGGVDCLLTSLPINVTITNGSNIIISPSTNGSNPNNNNNNSSSSPSSSSTSASSPSSTSSLPSSTSAKDARSSTTMQTVGGDTPLIFAKIPNEDNDGDDVVDDVDKDSFESLPPTAIPPGAPPAGSDAIDICQGYKVDTSVLDMLAESSQDYLCRLVHHSLLLCTHAGRDFLLAEDVQLAHAISASAF
eukprot:TRINITY_DN7825_c0_g1_i5.p1 TRINITY_DN7825_c0_g1~~TRINITY_DN7825_c0_g1_i5.p1  ORF type:complete len:612 (-),score=99.60 TRINITY_DN7825_c0_g1_i5:64-1899(-)